MSPRPVRARFTPLRVHRCSSAAPNHVGQPGCGPREEADPRVAEVTPGQVESRGASLGGRSGSGVGTQWTTRTCCPKMPGQEFRARAGGWCQGDGTLAGPRGLLSCVVWRWAVARGGGGRPVHAPSTRAGVACRVLGPWWDRQGEVPPEWTGLCLQLGESPAASIFNSPAKIWLGAGGAERGSASPSRESGLSGQHARSAAGGLPCRAGLSVVCG